MRSIRRFRVGDRGVGTRALPIWTLLLVVLLASASLWGPGMVNTRGGGDSPFLLQRLHQMTVNLRAGVFPVRWMPDAAYGLGFPFFNHYSALPFYLAACFNLLGLDALTALKLTQTLGLLFAALAMFGWVNHLWRDRAAAWLAAVAYTVAPFHLVNLYVRGDSLSEFYAFVFYPLVLWALERVVESASTDGDPLHFGKETVLNVTFLALAYAGLILAHNISAFIFSPFVLLYLLLLVSRSKVGRSPAPPGQGMAARRLWPFGLGLGGLLLGAALSAWAWLPALLERGYVQSEGLLGGFFDYVNHFRSANLVQPKFWFDYSIEVSLGGPSPFAIGGPQALVAAVGLLILLRFAFDKGQSTESQEPTGDGPSAFVSRRGRASFVFFIVGLLLSTIMITPLSRPLWDHVPLLPMVQFPWRFLSVQALFAAVAAAVWVLRLKGRRAWIVAGVIAAALVASTLLPLQPERLPIGPQDVTTTRLQEYELFTGNIGTTVRYEWLPQAAVPRPFTSDAVIEPGASPEVIPLAGSLDSATQSQRRPTQQTWRVQTGEAGATLAFPLLYWPGWRAWVDGEDTQVWATESAGYLALKVPAGEHTVRLKLGRTTLRTAAELLSLIAALVVLAVGLWHAWRSSRILNGAACVWRHAIRNASYALLFSVALLVLSAQSSAPANRLDDLTMDFVTMPYLHHNPDGIAFEGQTRLLSYTLSTDRLAPGDTLTVTLNWEPSQHSLVDQRASLRLASPAEHLPDLQSGPLTLTEDSLPLAETTVHRLTVPENTPRGIYLLQLSLFAPDGALSARTTSGEGSGPVYLRPVRVVQGATLPPEAPLLALAGPDIRLHAAELEPNAPYLTVHLEWSVLRRLAANYNISLRLLDPAGNQRVVRDTQPGYGFSPTSLWRPGERVGDRYNLMLPGDLLPGGGYRLLLVFYRLPSLAEVARVDLGPFALPLASPVAFTPHPRLFELPTLSHPLEVDFSGPPDTAAGDHIQLAGYDLTVEGGSLDLTLWWVAQRRPQIDYTVFVHLFDPAAETDIITQSDAMPRSGSYPTSGWLAGEVVSDTVRLSLDAVPEGDYRLALGLFDATTGDRLYAAYSDGESLPDGRLVLPDAVEVPVE